MDIDCSDAHACQDLPAFTTYYPDQGTLLVGGLPLSVTPYVEQITYHVNVYDMQPVPAPNTSVFIPAALVFAILFKTMLPRAYKAA